MNIWHHIIILLFCGMAGWASAALLTWSIFRPYKKISIAGFSLQGVFPAKQQVIAAKAGEAAARSFSFQAIEEKISSPEALEKIKPEIEKHLDVFLREKLKVTFPIISNFIGEKTINQLKSAFMNELQELFPMLMKHYAGQLQDDLDLKAKVADRIAAIAPEEAEAAFKSIAGKQLVIIKIAGSVIGLFAGAICLVILHWV